MEGIAGVTDSYKTWGVLLLGENVGERTPRTLNPIEEKSEDKSNMVLLVILSVTFVLATVGIVLVLKLSSYKRQPRISAPVNPARDALLGVTRLTLEWRRRQKRNPYVQRSMQHSGFPESLRLG